MTTTTKPQKAQQPPTAAAPIGDGWDEAPQASAGSSDYPEWLPQLALLRDDVAANKLTLKPAGSHFRPVIVGPLRILQAYGEPRYFVDETVDGKVVTMALPPHGALTSSLDHMDIAQKPLVRLAFMGEAARARPGQRAAFMFDVRVKPTAAYLVDARADALLPIHKENKAKRDAAAKAAGAEAEEE